MSAYVVDPLTIDFLIAYCLTRRNRLHVYHDLAPSVFGTGPGGVEINEQTADRWGQVLQDENVRSVQYRYPQDTRDTLPGPSDLEDVYSYRHVHTTGLSGPIKPVDVLSVLRCYEYQACETPDWKETLAAALVEAIRHHAISALTMDSPWGISRGTRPAGLAFAREIDYQLADKAAAAEARRTQDDLLKVRK